MEPTTLVTVISAVGAVVTISAAYHIGAYVERRRHYHKEFQLRGEIKTLELKLEDMPTHSAVGRSSSRSSASTDHGFTSGVSVGSSFSGPSSCSSDSGSSSSSDSGSCM